MNLFMDGIAVNSGNMWAVSTYLKFRGTAQIFQNQIKSADRSQDQKTVDSFKN